MKIIGYSERGVMNALFYSMSLKNDDNAMRHFLELAGIADAYSYQNFYLYPEFSLSEFGTPDMVIIAEKPERTIFFVEAKVSAAQYFNISEELRKYNDFILYGKCEKENSSNLFFQLMLKNIFFNLKDYWINGQKVPSVNVSPYGDNQKRIENSRGRRRQIGKNPIVNNFAKHICTGSNSANYIAIIPKQDVQIPDSIEKACGFPICFITWEEILNDPLLKCFTDKTMIFNEVDGVSQIINNKPK